MPTLHSIPRTMGQSETSAKVKETVIESPSVALNDGRRIPLLGLGTLTNMDVEKVDKIADNVYEAICAGFRHIDTAWAYMVEEAVGAGISRAIRENIVTRDQLFVTTKVWPTNLRREALISQTKDSLKKLGLEYVDLLLVHWPVPLVDDGKGVGKACYFPNDGKGVGLFDHGCDIYQETWPAMEEVHSAGLAKSIGVSNYNSEMINKTCEVAKVKPVVNQIESTPFLTQESLMNTCARHGIVLVAFSPLGGSPRPTADGSLAPHAVKQELHSHPVILSLCKKYGKSVPQVLLKFQVQRGVAAILKSGTKAHLVENGSIFDFKFTEEEMRTISSLNCGKRTCVGRLLKTSPLYPFNQD